MITYPGYIYLVANSLYTHELPCCNGAVRSGEDSMAARKVFRYSSYVDKKDKNYPIEGFIVRHEWLSIVKDPECYISHGLISHQEEEFCAIVATKKPHVLFSRLSEFFNSLCKPTTIVSYYLHNTDFDPKTHFYMHPYFKIIKFF